MTSFHHDYSHLTSRGVATSAGMPINVLRPDFRGVSRLQILNVVYQLTLINRILALNKSIRTTEGDANSVGRTYEIMCQCCDLSAITDSNWTIVSMGVVVARLLVVLELMNKIVSFNKNFACTNAYTFHQREEV